MGKKREENKLHLLEMVSNSKLAFQEERRPTTLKLPFADNGFPVFNTHQGHTLLLHFIPVIQQFSIFRIQHNLLVGLYLSLTGQIVEPNAPMDAVVEELELWDMPILLLLLIALIGSEWGYRRIRGLS